jgi:hypothetical protein
MKRLIKTQRELADAVGRDESQISRYRRHDNWPFGGPPWKSSIVPDVQRWIADELRAEADKPGTSEAGSLRRAKLRAEIRKLEAQAAAAELELARERGAVIDAVSVRQEWSACGQAIRAGLQSMPAALAAVALRLGLPNPQIAEFQRETTSLIDGALQALSKDGAK